jgi:hypothetical protein
MPTHPEQVQYQETTGPVPARAAEVEDTAAMILIASIPETTMRHTGARSSKHGWHNTASLQADKCPPNLLPPMVPRYHLYMASRIWAILVWPVCRPRQATLPIKRLRYVHGDDALSRYPC